MSSVPTDPRSHALQAALDVAVQRRAQLAALKAAGRPGAGIEALCNGALRTVIRLSLESRQNDNGKRLRGLTRRQMDKVMRLLSERRTFAQSTLEGWQTGGSRNETG